MTIKAKESARLKAYKAMADPKRNPNEYERTVAAEKLAPPKPQRSSAKANANANRQKATLLMNTSSVAGMTAATDEAQKRALIKKSQLRFDKNTALLDDFGRARGTFTRAEAILAMKAHGYRPGTVSAALWALIHEGFIRVIGKGLYQHTYKQRPPKKPRKNGET
jgi:hypothetical protein